MRLIRVFVATVLIAAAAQAHQVVDVRMGFDVPLFIPIQQNFKYRVIADDLNNDNGLGIVVTIVLPAAVRFSSVAGGNVWRCSESRLTLTCSAEQIVPGPNPIDITVTAPAQTGPLHATTSVTSIGTLDLNASNDNAASEIFAYDPKQCTASPPLLFGPDDESTQPPVVPLSWSAVPGAQSYIVFTSVEGSGAAPVATTDRTETALVAEPGRAEWWVVAAFGTCPPVTSSRRHFTAPESVPRNVITYAGNPDLDLTRNGPRGTAAFRKPFGLALSPQDELYVSDEADHVVRRIANDSVVTIAGNVGSSGATEGQFALFQNPRGLAVTPLDGFVYAADTLNHEIRILYTGGPFIPAFDVGGASGSPGYVDAVGDKARFNAPSGVAATERGNLYVADTKNNLIRKMTQVQGFIGLFTVSTAASGFHAPLGVAVDSNEIVYLADTDDHTIRKIVSGIVSTLAGESGVSGSSDGRGATAHFDHPTGIALDSRGILFVTDGNGVRRIAPSGLVTTVASGFIAPAGIAVDASGRIFVADSGNHTIRLIEPAAAPPETPARRRAVH